MTTFFSVLRIDWSSLLIQWKRSADDPCGRVVMWDTRGFENIHSGEHQSLLLRYILEGRLHPQNLQQALLLSDETCKKRYVSLQWNQFALILKMKFKLDFPQIQKRCQRQSNRSHLICGLGRWEARLEVISRHSEGTWRVKRWENKEWVVDVKGRDTKLFI